MTTPYRQAYDRANQSRLQPYKKDGVEFSFLPFGKRREQIECELFDCMGDKDIWNSEWMKMNVHDVPDITFILKDEKPIGVVSFENLPFRQSIDSEKGVTIQVNFVYLLPEYRGQGVSKLICGYVVDMAMAGMTSSAQASSLNAGDKMVMGLDMECISNEGFKFHGRLKSTLEAELERIYLSSEPLSEISIEIKDFSDLGGFEIEKVKSAPQLKH